MAYTKRPDFFSTLEGIAIEEQLKQMIESSLYATDSSYSANSTNYPDNKIPFLDKHKNYLIQHQNVNPNHYLSNLKLMTKLKLS